MEASKCKKFKLDFWNVVTIGIFLIFAVCLIYPLFSLFFSSLKDSNTGEFTLSNFVQFFTKKYYYESLWRSFSVTIITTILTIVIGVPLAYVMTTCKIKGKGLIEILIIISVLSPPFIGAYSWILLLGRSGVITTFLSDTFGINLPSIYGFSGILLVFTLKLFPFIYMYTTGALKKLDVSLIEASESLGCTGVKKVFTVVIPLILPTVLAGSLLVFMNALADFGTPMLIGEGYQVMPVLIYSEFISEVGGQANFAAALSAIMVFITTIIFLGQKYVVNKKSFVMSSLKPIQPKKINGIKSFFAHTFVYIVVGLAIIPQVTVIFTSFLKTKGAMFIREFSLNSYINVIGKLGSSIRNTFVYGIIAIILIIILGMFISYVSVRRKNLFTSILDTLTMFPYIIPGSVLGITLLLAFNKKPILLSGTFMIIVIAFVIRRLPYTIRSSAAILYQISPSMEEASISLGYSQFQTFKNVTSRMMLPGVISGAILSWITVINELSASIILYTGTTRTMSVAIYSEVIRASYGTAAALSSILTFTTIISLLIFFKLTGSRDISL
ncbi:MULTISPECIES: ABC transporter permease [Clostridium]|jgi:iron(III) transport system permease protein|uniref:ABC transporter permease subunit n=1 Tax=Clostridium butyricum TaxID=1492 RepID=A0A6L9EL88_CLOBU|nr:MULTISPECIES: iron ABC transporter permease [Clostridium]ETI90573.1 MAG: Binding-protein-dependent transport system inner membrane component [Clostridium butyricum DORA_1]APF23262.1 binding--dependent transport system inner membrane component family protein [Clostridium butyricum]AXB84669.1 iron ABC transporter permease [Clostridium butyricum]ENZ36324.1 Fe3+ ABC transporter permease [Clostridium butyricum 60E.3]KIU07569.1 binding-protein-dependent transport systems inner membrane component 